MGKITTVHLFDKETRSIERYGRYSCQNRQINIPILLTTFSDKTAVNTSPPPLHPTTPYSEQTRLDKE
jgi:hypothetical protein